MRDIKQARALQRMAHKDFAALKGMAQDVITFADEIFGFHAQQAAEKGLKAFLLNERLQAIEDALPCGVPDFRPKRVQLFDVVVRKDRSRHARVADRRRTRSQPRRTQGCCKELVAQSLGSRVLEFGGKDQQRRL